MLPQRLQAPLALLEGTGLRVGDIGADHGLLTQAILTSKTASECHAVEISLDAFESGIGMLTPRTGLHVHLGDGLAPLAERGVELDAVVVTGIGAVQTARILDAELLRRVGATQVVVQCWPPNLLPLLALSRRMEASGFQHSHQIMTVHGKSRTSITSSFVRHAREQELDQEPAASLRRWPLARLAADSGPGVATKVKMAAEAGMGTEKSQLDIYKDYLRMNCFPILTALHYRNGRTGAGTDTNRGMGTGANRDTDTDSRFNGGVGTLTDRELEALVVELQSQLQ
jgi:hypothetical protein